MAAKKKAWGCDPTKAATITWEDSKDAFSDARWAKPTESAVGVLLSDTGGGMSSSPTFYWFESVEELVAWTVRCAVPFLGDDDDEIDDEVDEDAPVADDQDQAEREVRELAASVRKRGLAPIEEALDGGMTWTQVDWIGNFASLCESKGEGAAAVRTEFWYSHEEDSESDETHGDAPIQAEHREEFADYLEQSNES